MQFLLPAFPAAATAATAASAAAPPSFRSPHTSRSVQQTTQNTYKLTNSANSGQSADHGLHKYQPTNIKTSRVVEMLTPDRSAARRLCRLNRTALITPSVKLLIMFGYGSRGFIDYQCRFVLISLGPTTTVPHTGPGRGRHRLAATLGRDKLFARQLQ